jgi:ribosomal protein L29
MDIKEIKNQSIASLNNLLIELRSKEEEMKFKVVQGQLKNVRSLRIVKKDIARILMTLAEMKKNNQLKEEKADVKVIANKEETTK